MKHISIKAFFLATVASFFLAIIISILGAVVSDIAESVIFGDAGAYSYEDHQEVQAHTSVTLFYLFSSILTIIVPCAVAAIVANSYKVTHALLMACLGVIYSYLTWIHNFMAMEVNLLLGYTIISLVLALPTGLVVRKFSHG